jgi:hypothetical protein
MSSAERASDEFAQHAVLRIELQALGGPMLTRTLLVLTCALIAIAGCARDYEYSRPNLQSREAGTITGSKQADGDFRAYLIAIDGKLTLDGPRGWDDRTIVVPGIHNIRFAVGNAPLLSAEAWGFGETRLNVEAGKTYIIRAADPTRVTPVCAVAAEWIEERGAAVTDRIMVTIKTFTGGELPIPGGGFVSFASHTVCPERT